MSNSNTQFNHLRIPLKKIKKATNNFSEKNIIGKGDFGYIYEGHLLHSGELINISARRLDRSQGQGDVEFWTEVSVLSGLKHPNIVSLIGFCDEKGEKIIINSHEPKGSLGMYLSDLALTWIQRLNINIGVARAISYIHYEEGRNYSIIHRNINSSTILLDDNFEAKLSGFEFSIKDSMDRMERYIPLEVVGTQGYMDPETLKSGYVTQKSDIYSFGVVLCEIMCGRKAFLPNEQETNMFLASLAGFHLQNDTLQDIINPGIFNQMALESYKMFVDAVDSSITKDPQERTSMKENLFLLNEALYGQVPSLNPRVAATFPSLGLKRDENGTFEPLSKDELGVVVESKPNAWKVNKLEHLRIGFIDIQLATNNFSKKSEIFLDDLFDVFKGDLECFDRMYISSLKGKNIGKLPKRRYNVRILRNKTTALVDMFYKQIEVLSTCKHYNIDSLLGFCDEGSNMILVFEGKTFNTLDDYLSSQVLTWYTRLRICLDVANGLNYIHNGMEDHKMVIHRLLSSMCIFLDDNLQRAKINGFGLSIFCENQDEDAFHLQGDDGLSDIWSSHDMAPEFSGTGRATKESDIYSFGVVMLEVLCGLNYAFLKFHDAKFRAELWFKDGKIKQRVAQVLKEENRGNKLFLKEGPNEDSLDTFIKITEQCLAVNPKQRPTLKVIIMELRKALTFQKNHKDRLRMSFRDIKSATQNFN